MGRVRKALRQAGVSWRKVLGGRDESEPVLRLADALAGFLRDMKTGEGEALAIWPAFATFFREG